jgi:hypothetical protein
MTIITQDPAISFGVYVTGSDILVAVRETIQKWSYTYLAEMARHDGQNPALISGLFPDFASFPSSLDISSRLDEQQMPACVIVVPGIPLKPYRHGNGKLDAGFDVGIGIAVTGQDVETTRKLAQLYGAAVRLLILQQGDLGGLATGVAWNKESYTGTFVHPDDQRTLAIGELEFTFSVDNVADDSQGPTTPLAPSNPPTGWPVVEYPSMTVTGSEPGQEL